MNLYIISDKEAKIAQRQMKGGPHLMILGKGKNDLLGSHVEQAQGLGPRPQQHTSSVQH